MIGPTLLVQLFGVVLMVHLTSADNMQAFLECKKEFNVSREEIMADGSSQELKCFAECLLKKTGCMDENGNFDEEKIKAEGNKFAKTDEQRAKFEGDMTTCLGEAKTADGECGKGYTFAKCLRTQFKNAHPVN